ncbi:sensor histidine kinase [Paraflavitalea pollutisoli]|uniref:sensor histidine kinase n=1 Tax=Paraflavitalea pollutisoli TaxID=3034143 RepID=UPI0023EAA538|nr:histidine kinase [Paraflavitalea sp. H1-2-19X]
MKHTVQEIHDNIGQVLSLAKLHLGTLDFTRPDEVAQKAFYSKQLVGQAIRDLRNLARHLNADRFDNLGLLKALDYELACIPAERSADPLLQTSGQLPALSKEQELMLFRIIQESIHCFLGLGDQSRVSVCLKTNTDHFEIAISNIDQQELIAEQTPLPAAYLSKIHNRAALAGATLQIDQHSPNDLTIKINLPLSHS